MISCIIQISEKEKTEGISINHLLLSIGTQSFHDWEVIIVDNNSGLNFEKIIQELPLDTITKKRYFIHKMEEPILSSKAMNYGVEKSLGEILLFIDNSFIIENNDALNKIQKSSEKFVYGYGAIKKGMTLEYSFVHEFGYCKRDIFSQTGGFLENLGCQLGGQFLMYKLLKTCGRGKLLNTISLQNTTIIKNHKETDYSHLYFDELLKDGTFWFNINSFLSGKDENVIQKTEEYHADYRIENAYNDYIKYIPGNIKKDDYGLQEIRKDKNRYSLQDFSIIISELIQSEDLDGFIRNSVSDFDNLMPIIYAVIKNNLVEINNEGKFSVNLNFSHFPKFHKDEDMEVFENPNDDYNQFPCDIISRKRRLNLITERYPFADYIKVALIGDDDLVGPLLGNERWIDVTIFEKDERIKGKIPKNFNTKFIECDFQKQNLNNDNINNVQTFFSDPPYTLNGALLFIYQGLSLLKNDNNIKEFYVILNQTMIGKYLLNIQQILSECGIWLHQTRENFSQYELPKGFKERERANDFLSIQKILPTNLSLSSSSNLYIFRTTSFDLEKLRKKIDLKKIYEHFTLLS